MHAAILIQSFFALVLFPPQGVAQNQPDGTYIDREARDPISVVRNSGVEFKFTNGRYELRRDSLPRVVGRYRVSGDTIHLTDVEGPWACTTAATVSAAYRWTPNANGFVLTPLANDACNRRRNRLAGTSFIRAAAPALAKTITAPVQLDESWQQFWLKSDVSGWIDQIFAADAVAEDGNRRLNGIDEIREWLGGQDSRSPRAFPFQFTISDSSIIEKGRYRDVFGSPDGSTRLLVGRYQITWIPAAKNRWKVKQWILR